MEVHFFPVRERSLNKEMVTNILLQNHNSRYRIFAKKVTYADILPPCTAFKREAELDYQGQIIC